MRTSPSNGKSTLDDSRNSAAPMTPRQSGENSGGGDAHGADVSGGSGESGDSHLMLTPTPAPFMTVVKEMLPFDVIADTTEQFSTGFGLTHKWEKRRKEVRGDHFIIQLRIHQCRRQSVLPVISLKRHPCYVSSSLFVVLPSDAGRGGRRQAGEVAEGGPYAQQGQVQVWRLQRRTARGNRGRAVRGER